MTQKETDKRFLLLDENAHREEVKLKMPRTVGAVNESTRITREVFNLAFTELGGVRRLVEWAEKDDNLKHFYTLFAKVLPKEIKTEDQNRAHEQFIELMMMEEEQRKLEEGKPFEFIEAPGETDLKSGEEP